MHALSGVKRLLDRSVAAQAVVVFLLVAAVTRLLRWDESVAVWLARSALWTGVGVVFVLVRRRRDRAVMGGASADRHAEVERKLARGQVPGDPAERGSMRALVAHRRHQMDAYAWSFVPLLVVLVLLPVLWVVQGLWTAALLILVFGIVFGSWVVWARGRNQDRLRFMARALGEAERVPGEAVAGRH